MQWRLFADIAETAGAHDIELDLDGDATVDDALSALLDRHPELTDEVLDNGELAGHLTVLKNGTNVDGFDAGFDSPVAPDDELALFPPISGG